MQTYSFRQAPFRVFGVPFFEKTGVLERLPQALAAALILFGVWGVNRFRADN